MKKNCVIFGGASVEHDISIITGIQLGKNYKGLEKIYIGLNNKFYLASKIENLDYFFNKEKINLKEIIFYDGAVYLKGKFFKKLFDVDCVINCCHGGIGENGDLISFLSINNIKCSSADSLFAHISMNKYITKQLVEDIVPTVKGKLVCKDNFDNDVKEIKKTFSNNLIVKPNSLGSSVGVKACNKQNFKEQIMAIFELNDDALVEERVVDLVEFNQACLKTKDGLILSAIEQPIFNNDFLTFEDKYKKREKTKGADRIIPAKIPPELEEQIINCTTAIYNKLKMNGVVRIDYIYDDASKTLYFNEINTVPGSMAFYLFEPVGIDYITLINLIIDNAKEVNKFKYLETNILENKQI